MKRKKASSRTTFLLRADVAKCLTLVCDSLLLRPILECARVNQPKKEGKDASRGI